MLKMPPSWEHLLKGYLKRTFYSDTRRRPFADRADFTEGDYRFFAEGVRDLNLAFTQERHSLPKNYFNRKELRSGYILYFLPVNALKVTALLKDLPLPPPYKGGGEKMRVLDIGSGPGTGMLGAMAHLENQPENQTAEWTLVDQNRSILQDAAALHDGARMRCLVADLATERPSRFFSGEKFDLILSINFLSELSRERRLTLVEQLIRHHLADSGRFLIIEPALRQTTRELMELHDRLVERRSAAVLAPCLHQAACPMLAANNRDWCHTYLEWERPPWIEKIDRLVGIRKDYLKCSYLVLGQVGTPLTAPLPDTWRVVSGPLNSKGKSERLLCGPAGLPNLVRITRLDRDRSEANFDFDRLQRGDILQKRYPLTRFSNR